MQCIGEAFGVDASNEEQQKRYSTKPANLLSIFDVYLNTKSKTSATKVRFLRGKATFSNLYSFLIPGNWLYQCC